MATMPHRDCHQKRIDPSPEAFRNADGNRSHDHRRSCMIYNIGQEQRAGQHNPEQAVSGRWRAMITKTPAMD